MAQIIRCERCGALITELWDVLAHSTCEPAEVVPPVLWPGERLLESQRARVGRVALTRGNRHERRAAAKVLGGSRTSHGEARPSRDAG